jgi:hypothetical protein
MMVYRLVLKAEQNSRFSNEQISPFKPDKIFFVTPLLRKLFEVLIVVVL